MYYRLVTMLTDGSPSVCYYQHNQQNKEIIKGILQLGIANPNIAYYELELVTTCSDQAEAKETAWYECAGYPIYIDERN